MKITNIMKSFTIQLTCPRHYWPRIWLQTRNSILIANKSSKNSLIVYNYCAPTTEPFDDRDLISEYMLNFNELWRFPDMNRKYTIITLLYFLFYLFEAYCIYSFIFFHGYWIQVLIHFYCINKHCSTFCASMVVM